MTQMVTLTLTGAKRFMISGTTHTIEKWQQIRVDAITAEHLLDQYYTDRSNNELPMFEEGVVKEPPMRADRKRIRASQRRLDREADKARAAGVNPDSAEAMQAFRQDASDPQDPYGHGRREKEAPDWAVNTDVVVEPTNAKVETRVFEEPQAARPTVEVEAAPVKRAAKKKAKATTRKRKAKAK